MHRAHALDADPPDDQALPCPQALLGATLALMSAWAQPLADSPLPPQTGRPLLARKIVSNLFFLYHHPSVGASLRALAGRLHGHWVALAPTQTPPQPDLAAMVDACGPACPGHRIH